MGETLDWINQHGEEPSDGGSMFLEFSCSACGACYQRQGFARKHVLAMRKKGTHKKAVIHENFMDTDGDFYYTHKV